MTIILNLIQDNYRDIVSGIKENTRVISLPLMSNSYPVLAITALYLVFVLIIGPRFMKNREPFNLKVVIAGYNAYQVLFNLWIATTPIRHWEQLNPQNLSCTPVGYDAVPEAITNVMWLYFASKLVELLDTVFFVLRKKQSQVTFLHLYHHTFLALSTWVFLKYTFVEHCLVVITVNSFVHVVMYTYYLLAGMGPSVRKYIWWKKYITWIQLTQFVVLLAYVVGLVLFDCKLPKVVSVGAISNILIFLYLFGRFYRKAYRTTGCKKETEAHAITTTSNGNDITSSCNKTVLGLPTEYLFGLVPILPCSEKNHISFKDE